ncbi:MAG: ABC transporter permease [Treponema sp.]|nr:ABC transporter permease [Treponema sp.]
MRFIKFLGSAILNYYSDFPYLVGYMGKLFSSAFFFLKRERSAKRVLVMQLLFTFIEALPVIVFLSTVLGSVLYLLGYSMLLSMGQEGMIYSLLVVIIVQELGPVLVAFIVTARSATAIATELAGMVTSHQIEAYIAFGIDPVDFLAVPRFLGVTLSVFFLNLYFSICGIIGPFIAAKFLNPTLAADYLTGLFQCIHVSTVIISVIKSIVFGMIISITATYYGFKVERSSTEIPVAGISAVTKSFVGIIFSDVALIAAFFSL